MPSPPKKWHANQPLTIVEYADFLFRPDDQGAAPLAGERSVPLWALYGVIRGLIPLLRIKNKTGMADELVALTKSYVAVFEEGVAEREDLLAGAVPVHIKKRRTGGIHPVWVLRMQADLLLNVLNGFPCKERRNDAHRILWLKEHLPAALTDLKAITRCAARCPAYTRAELTEPDYQGLVKCKTIADLRIFVLAKLHGLESNYLRKLLSGASRRDKILSSPR